MTTSASQSLQEDTPYSHSSKPKINLRSTFISPELAYNNEKKKLFEKIGYTKQNIQQQYSLNKNDSQSQMVTKSLDKEMRQFVRRKTKVDDSFYEKRVHTLSKVKTKKSQKLIDDINTQSQGGSGIMKRLMTIRKQRQQKKDYDGDESQNNYANDICTYDFEAQNINLHNFNSRSGQSSVCGDGVSISFYNNKDDSFNQELQYMNIDKRNESAGKYTGVPFMSRRQQSQTKGNQMIHSSLNRRIGNIGIGGSNAKNSNLVSVEPAANGMIVINDMEGVGGGYQDDCYEGSNNVNNRSMISTNRGSNRIQICKAINKMNYLQFVPNIKGITKQQMLDLFQAKCKDLRINPSKDQMVRFFDIFQKQQQHKERKLNLVDMSLGNHSMLVVGQIIRKNTQFSILDLKKNFITNEGIATLSKYLLQNTTIVHLDVGCNQISSDGAITLFNALKNQKSITSLSLANTDCYKNKNKIGLKGAIVLSELIQQNQLIQILNIADNSLSQDGLNHLIHGLKENPHMTSINLSQNDLGTCSNSFTNLLSIFQPSKHNPEKVACTSLEELVLSNNQLTNKNIEDLSTVIKSCSRSKMHRLDVSQNKLTGKALLQLIQALRANQHFKLQYLNMDKTQIESGTHQEQINNFNMLMRSICDFLRTNKTLKVLSLNQCGINDDLVNAIGRGLQNNDKLEVLNLKHNQIYEAGISELLNAFENNKTLRLRCLDLSSNKLNDSAGLKLASGLRNVETLEQVNLRDNNFGLEAGEAFLFLVQQKKNLWKLQLDLNMIKYVTLLDIEKICKKNKRNAKYIIHVPEIKQEITSLICKKDSKVKIDEMDKQIKNQLKIIKDGQQQILYEEEFVHDLIAQGNQDFVQYENEIINLNSELERLDDVIYQIDAQNKAKEKEWQKKIEQEESLVEKAKIYTDNLQNVVNRQKEKVLLRRAQKQQNEEELKLKAELDRITREQDIMKMIIENYEKEIQRKLNEEAIQNNNNTTGATLSVLKPFTQHDSNVPTKQLSTLMGFKSTKQTIEIEKEDIKINESMVNKSTSNHDSTKNAKKKSKKRTSSKNPSKKKSNQRVKMISALMCQQHREKIGDNE